MAVCMAVVLATAVVARTGWTVYRWWGSGGELGLVFPDEHDYWAGAVSLAGGDGLVDADGRRATRMPLYPALLSLAADLPEGGWCFRGVQGFLGALIAPLIAGLAWRLAGRRAAWLAGLLAAVDPFAVYFSQLLLTEALFTVCLVGFWVAAWPLVLPDGRRRTWRWPVSAAIFLAMVYLRPSAIGLLPVWGLFVVVAARRAGGNFAGLTLMVTMLVAGLAPWAWRNHRLLGQPVLLTTRFGISLYDGQGPRADGSSHLGFTRKMAAHTLPECEWNRWFRNEAIKAMRSDPWRVWRLAWVKARRTWDPFPHAAEAQAPAIQAVSAGWTVGVLVLMAPGLWCWRRRAGGLLLLLLPAVYFTVVHMIFVGSVRYRLPVMPLIQILSAVGVCWLGGWLWPAWRPALPPTRPRPTDHPPATWFEQHVYTTRYGRRPVPLWRRRLAMAGLLSLGLGYYGYQYFTSDERIRQQAVNFLTRFTGGEVRIGRARFGLFSGISLRDVMIAMPGHIDFDPTAQSLEQRQVFAAVTLQLRHEPFSLLTGRLKVAEILADRPTVTLVKNAGHPDYTYNWQTLFPPRPQEGKGGRAVLPLIRIRDAHVRILEIIDNRRRPQPEIDLSALAWPDLHRLEAYTVEWRKTGDQPDRGRLFYKPGAGTYRGELPALPFATVKATLPERYREWLEALEIAGQIKPEQIHYDARRQSRATIRLDGIRLSVPMETEERPTSQAVKRFLKLSDVTGQLVLTPAQSTAKITGKLNQADCEVTATVTNYAGPLEEAGFDIHLKVDNVLLPDPNDAGGRRFIQRIKKVRGLFNDFDPHGRADIDLHLTKAPGRDMGVIVRGTMKPRGCDASYRFFPYRLTNVTGTVRFADDGVWLENLSGDHGSGLAVINGHLDSPDWFTGLRLDITADNAPLDPALRQAVPEKFRDIWRRFDTVGLANLNVRLRRAPGTREKGPGPWTTYIDAELVETFGRFVQFPYHLSHVTGRLIIDNDRIRVSGLTGMHGPTSVRLDGEARYGAEDGRELEFRLEARDLAIDEDLASVLPPDGRKAFDRMRPSGRVDLLGRVFMTRDAQHVSYDIAADLHDVAICYESLPCPVEKIRGRLAFTPQRIVLTDISGRRASAARPQTTSAGDATPTEITLRGHVEHRADGPMVDLTIGCDQLLLDKALYDVLPAGLKKTWDTFAPTGRIHLTTHIRRAGIGPKRVSTHETTIETLGNTVCYPALPVKVGDVRGRIHMTDEWAELRNMTGRFGEGRLQLSGRIPLVGRERTGRLRLRAEGMRFDEPLRKALPNRMRKAWDGLEPSGTFDLDLTELTYHVAPDRPVAWTYRGRLALHDATLNLGFEATEVEGSLSGHGTARGDGSDLTVDAALSLKRGAINQRVLTDLTGRMRRAPGSSTLVLSDLIGQIYGGRASGYGQAEFGPSDTRYGLHMIVRDMALGPFLNSTRSKDTPPTKATGTVDGRLYLSGVSGQVGSRHGAGEVHVRHAQMYKLPFVLAMLSTINFAIPDDNAFHNAQAVFHLQGDQLVFETIELQGKSLSMLGSGSMDTETETLNLTFLTGSPHPLPRIPLLTEMVQNVSRELMEIEITGPLSDPSMQGRSLRSLRTTLEALFAAPRPRP